MTGTLEELLVHYARSIRPRRIYMEPTGDNEGIFIGDRMCIGDCTVDRQLEENATKQPLPHKMHIWFFECIGIDTSVHFQIKAEEVCILPNP